MDATPLRDAYRTFLDAAKTVAEAPKLLDPPAGEWNADQILGHVALVDAAAISAATTIASGAYTTFDNRNSLDTWTIDRVVTHAGGNAGIRERVRAQGEVLCSVAEGVLSTAELDSAMPTLLLSGGELVVDQSMPLRALIESLGTHHLPGHTAQLLALLP